MARATYYDFYVTGTQDAANTFTPSDDLDLDAIAASPPEARAEMIVVRLREIVIDEDEFDGSVAEDEGLDPSEAYAQWVSGWISQASSMAEAAIARRARGVSGLRRAPRRRRSRVSRR